MDNHQIVICKQTGFNVSTWLTASDEQLSLICERYERNLKDPMTLGAFWYVNGLVHRHFFKEPRE